MNFPATRTTASGILALLLGCISSISFAQTVSSFDMDRYSTAGEGMFETFHVQETIPLQQVLDQELLASETMLLVTKTAAGNLALVRDQMAFHHIVQGEAAGKNWMATF